MILFIYNHQNHIVNISTAHKFFICQNFMGYIEGSHTVVAAYPAENEIDEILYAGIEQQCELWIAEFYTALESHGLTIHGLTRGVHNAKKENSGK